MVGFAALTSSVALMEVPTSWAMEKFKTRRMPTAWCHAGQCTARTATGFLVDLEAKPKELTGRSRSVSKDLTEQMKLIHKHTITHIY